MCKCEEEFVKACHERYQKFGAFLDVEARVANSRQMAFNELFANDKNMQTWLTKDALAGLCERHPDLMAGGHAMESLFNYPELAQWLVENGRVTGSGMNVYNWQVTKRAGRC